MWQQYADNHTGLCLVLDRQQWMQDIDSWCPAGRGHDKRELRPVHESVLYQDRPVGWDARTLHFSVEDVRSSGVGEVASRRVKDNLASLFFQKNTDWASEREFRSLIVGATEPAFISINESLVGVVVGEQCSQKLFQTASSRLRGSRQDAVARCHWQRGAPQLLPS